MIAPTELLGLINTTQAAAFIGDWLAENDLWLNCQPLTLLMENRRSPKPESTLDTSKVRGNRNNFSALPFTRRFGKIYYLPALLLHWLNNSVKPLAFKIDRAA